MRRLLILMTAVCLTGCASGPRVEYVPVKCPVPSPVVFEADPVEALSDAASLADIAVAYRVSRLQWKKAAEELKLKLDVYREPK